MHCKPPSLWFFINLSLSLIQVLNIGFKHLACPSDMWPPFSLLSSTHSLAFNTSPLRIKCLRRRHAPNHLHPRTMASSRSFTCPFAPFGIPILMCLLMPLPMKYYSLLCLISVKAFFLSEILFRWSLGRFCFCLGVLWKRALLRPVSWIAIASTSTFLGSLLGAQLVPLWPQKASPGSSFLKVIFPPLAVTALVRRKFR